ncbi:hypothetical protein KY290_004455 [Solanum tuberosum]|uniref:Uncharacterized protein n=1 Tax=Solanum tuberosum TaxID=4113 RepID=A0ABQ7WVS2_SOLTU|nr:hypothetical protein KY289_001660 [Solanum tuberosum]KAH0784857.1 hypothetical protein KY290_004455 [Solanum tuberosum]
MSALQILGISENRFSEYGQDGIVSPSCDVSATENQTVVLSFQFCTSTEDRAVAYWIIESKSSFLDVSN